MSVATDHGPRTTDASDRGFTLLESMLAAALLAVAVISLCGVIGAAHQNATAGEEQSVAWMLAGQLMGQIAARPFADIDDYDCYNDRTDDLEMSDGTAVAVGKGRYRRDVDVEYRVSPTGPKLSAGNFAVVTVTVQTPAGNTVTLRRLFTNVELRR